MKRREGQPLSRYDTKRQRSETSQDYNNQSSTSLKNKVRSIERLIKKNKLAEDVLLVQERKLRTLKEIIAKRAKENLSVKETNKNKEKRLAVRYHKVKFFERVKLVRKLNQLSQKSEKAEEFKKLSDDLRYIMFFPKSEKFISIIKEDSELNERALKKRSELREAAILAANKAKFNIREFLSQQKKTRKQQTSAPPVEAHQPTETDEEIGKEDDFFV